MHEPVAMDESLLPRQGAEQRPWPRVPELFPPRRRGFGVAIVLVLLASTALVLSPSVLGSPRPALRGLAKRSFLAGHVEEAVALPTVAKEGEPSYRPYLGIGEETWWVPVNVMMGTVFIVAAFGYLTAPSAEEQWRKPPRGCDTGDELFMYRWKCDRQRYRCLYCDQVVCGYHSPPNITGVVGGHDGCNGPGCEIEPEGTRECQAGELWVCMGCRKRFCGAHKNPPLPLAKKPAPGHRCPMRRSSSYRLQGTGRVPLTPEEVHARNGPEQYVQTRADNLWSAYGAGLLALVLLCAGVLMLKPVYRLWLSQELWTLDLRAFPIPPAPRAAMPSVAVDCGCVLIGGQVILSPITMDAATVVLMFLVSFLSTVLRDWLGFKKRQEGQTLADLMWHSVREPSHFVLVPAVAVHLHHFLALVLAQGTFEGVYANWLNSGMVAFIITGTYGSALSTVMFDLELPEIGKSATLADIKKPAILRMAASFIFLVMALPCLVWYVLFAVINWCWLWITMEVMSALMVQVIFPEAASKVAEFQEESRRAAWNGQRVPRCRRKIFGVFYLVMLIVFPLQEPMNFLAPYLRLKQTQTPVGPVLRTLLLSCFCLLKTWELQFLLAFELFYANGVGYWDSVALSYTSRHVACNVCMALKHFERLAGSPSEELAMESLRQALSFLR